MPAVNALELERRALAAVDEHLVAVHRHVRAEAVERQAALLRAAGRAHERRALAGALGL